ncbi:hypothetical protein QQF64_017156 [Cirrhinus molitorella]|uniref:Uncharacterized protein n=1 Tax=Cirrhinus molitorella TaxID=172907 RepID=A0ABR3LHV3_9TELE
MTASVQVVPVSAPLPWLLSGSSHDCPHVQTMRFLLWCSRSPSLAALVPELPVVLPGFQPPQKLVLGSEVPGKSAGSQMFYGHSERFMPRSSLRCFLMAVPNALLHVMYTQGPRHFCNGCISWLPQTPTPCDVSDYQKCLKRPLSSSTLGCTNTRGPKTFLPKTSQRFLQWLPRV